MLRAMPDRLMSIDDKRQPKALESDRRRAFLTDGPCHLVNRASVRKLLSDIKNKYQDDPETFESIDVSERSFRPSLVIDTPNPYEEDSIQEMRFQNLMWRQTGPCIRCKLTTVNWKRNCFHEKMEPYNSLVNFRKHPQLGIIFGVYFTPDMITNKEDFTELLGSEYPAPKEFDKEGTLIQKGDMLLVRREEVMWQVEPAYTSG